MCPATGTISIMILSTAPDAPHIITVSSLDSDCHIIKWHPVNGADIHYQVNHLM